MSYKLKEDLLYQSDNIRLYKRDFILEGNEIGYISSMYVVIEGDFKIVYNNPKEPEWWIRMNKLDELV